MSLDMIPCEYKGRTFSSPREGLCSQKLGCFFPAPSAAGSEGLTPSPAGERSGLIAADGGCVPLNARLGSVPRSSRSFNSNKDVCASRREYLVKIKTVCRKRILAPISALKDEAGHGRTSPQPARGTENAPDPPDLQLRLGGKRIQMSHHRTAVLP